MSGYVSKIDLTIPFDGREVRLTLTPLLREDLFKLQAYLPAGVQLGDKVDFNEIATAFEYYASRLSKYVVAHDVKNAAGEDVPVAEWSAVSYFMELVGKIMGQHMQKASPKYPLLSAGPEAGTSDSA